MDDLSLKIGKINLIRICNSDGSDTCCCKIHSHRSTKSACTDDQHFCIEEFLLALGTNLFEDDVTGITLQLFVCK